MTSKTFNGILQVTKRKNQREAHERQKSERLIFSSNHLTPPRGLGFARDLPLPVSAQHTFCALATGPPAPARVHHFLPERGISQEGCCFMNFQFRMTHSPLLLGSYPLLLITQLKRSCNNTSMCFWGRGALTCYYQPS